MNARWLGNAVEVPGGDISLETNSMNAVDTNVFVYFFDDEEPAKQAKATELLDRLVQPPSETVLLWQHASKRASIHSTVKTWMTAPRMTRWKSSIRFVEERYERIKRGEFDVLRNLERLGELLIAVRIYLGLPQAELAERLDVDPSVVCRDERNEYHGVTLERAVKILNVMGVELRTSVEVPGYSPVTLSRETPGGRRPTAARTEPAVPGRTG